MGEIHKDIEKIVQELKDQLSKILITPFKSFTDNELPKLIQKGHYRHVTSVLQKLDKLCYYGMGVEDLLSKEEYSPIASEETKLTNQLEKYIEQIKK